MATFWKTATANAFNTTLNGAVGAADSSITLTAVTGLQFPGILVIDRQNAAGGNTPTLKEYISYTGISSNTLTGCSRGLGSSTAQSHASGAIVEEVFTVSHWNDLLTILLNVFTSGGALDTTKVADLTTAQTWTNKILTSPTVNTPTIKSATQTSVTLSGTTPTINLNNGNVFYLTMSGSTTYTASNTVKDQFFIVEVTQGSGTTYTNTWFSGITWITSGGTAPVQTATSNGITTYGFHCTGSSTYNGYLVGTN